MPIAHKLSSQPLGSSLAYRRRPRKLASARYLHSIWQPLIQYHIQEIMRGPREKTSPSAVRFWERSSSSRLLRLTWASSGSRRLLPQAPLSTILCTCSGYAGLRPFNVKCMLMSNLSTQPLAVHSATDIHKPNWRTNIACSALCDTYALPILSGLSSDYPLMLWLHGKLVAVHPTPARRAVELYKTF